GCNLSIQRVKKKLHFLEMLKLECSGQQVNVAASFKHAVVSDLLHQLHNHSCYLLSFSATGENENQDGFVDLYAKILGAVEICFSPEYSMDHITIVIDDVSLLEIAAHGSANQVLDFLHYCVTLTSEMDCSLVVLNHEDIYSSSGAPALLSYLEYLADIIIKAEPLPTGLSVDVHGQSVMVLVFILVQNPGLKHKTDVIVKENLGF
ncbi:hypothetical protein Taro_030081, partial [Colocasia esculenta]|nr:hypothetical protein [Colocasia esculenta]